MLNANDDGEAGLECLNVIPGGIECLEKINKCRCPGEECERCMSMVTQEFLRKKEEEGEVLNQVLELEPRCIRWEVSNRYAKAGHKEVPANFREEIRQEKIKSQPNVA